MEGVGADNGLPRSRRLTIIKGTMKGGGKGVWGVRNVVEGTGSGTDQRYHSTEARVPHTPHAEQIRQY